MDIKTLCDTLRPLFHISDEVMNTNAHFQSLLADRLIKTGKPIEQLTIAEITQLIDQTTAEYEALQDREKR